MILPEWHSLPLSMEEKYPNELYSAGEYFSTTISTNCTIDAITAINRINLKKVRSVANRPVSLSKYVLISQLIGMVIPNTKYDEPVPIQKRFSQFWKRPDMNTFQGNRPGPDFR